MEPSRLKSLCLRKLDEACALEQAGDKQGAETKFRLALVADSKIPRDMNGRWVG